MWNQIKSEVTKINVPFDCGNSPKREFIKEFNIAFAEGNADFIIEHVSDDIVWTMYGDKKIEGKEAFSKEIHNLKEKVADKMTLNSIITHGKEAAANGEVKMDDKTYAFCDVYVFTNNTDRIIEKIDYYVISI